MSPSIVKDGARAAQGEDIGGGAAPHILKDDFRPTIHLSPSIAIIVKMTPSSPTAKMPVGEASQIPQSGVVALR